MATPTTPQQPPKDADDDMARHTRPPEPPTPSNFQQRKKKKTGDFQAPAIDLTGKNAARPQADLASATINALIEEQDRQGNVKREVLQDLAGTLDGFMSHYKGDHKRSHYEHAKSVVQAFLDFVKVKEFADTGGAFYAPYKLKSSQPTTTSTSDQKAPAKSAAGSQTSKQISWADVAGRGKRANLSAGASYTGASSYSGSTGSALAAKEDCRILIRLGTQQRLAAGQEAASAYAARQTIVAAFSDLGIRMADAPECSRTNTGWSLRLATPTWRDCLLEPENKERLQVALGAEKIDVPEKWHNYVVPEVPLSIPDWLNGGRQDVNKALVEGEVVAQTGLNPVDCKPSRHGPNVSRGTCSWLVSFKEPVRPFRVFNASGLSRLIVKKETARIHDPGCQGYCNTKRCLRVARCHRCGGRKDDHGPGQCQLPEKCANCHGPFQAGHQGCPAAPKRQDGRIVRPTKKELQAIRRSGAQRYAEANAVEAESTQDEAEGQGASLVDLTGPDDGSEPTNTTSGPEPTNPTPSGPDKASSSGQKRTRSRATSTATQGQPGAQPQAETDVDMEADQLPTEAEPCEGNESPTDLADEEMEEEEAQESITAAGAKDKTLAAKNAGIKKKKGGQTTSVSTAQKSSTAKSRAEQKQDARERWNNPFPTLDDEY
jgi:hypothetical protein